MDTPVQTLAKLQRDISRGLSERELANAVSLLNHPRWRRELTAELKRLNDIDDFVARTDDLRRLVERKADRKERDGKVAFQLGIASGATLILGTVVPILMAPAFPPILLVPLLGGIGVIGTGHAVNTKLGDEKKLYDQLAEALRGIVADAKEPKKDL